MDLNICIVGATLYTPKCLMNSNIPLKIFLWKYDIIINLFDNYVY